MSSKRYPDEFTIEAVKQVVELGYPVAQVAKRLGGLFRILCQREVAWFIRSKIDHRIKSAFEEDR